MLLPLVLGGALAFVAGRYLFSADRKIDNKIDDPLPGDDELLEGEEELLEDGDGPGPMSSRVAGIIKLLDNYTDPLWVSWRRIIAIPYDRLDAGVDHDELVAIYDRLPPHAPPGLRDWLEAMIDRGEGLSDWEIEHAADPATVSAYVQWLQDTGRHVPSEPLDPMVGDGGGDGGGDLDDDLEDLLDEL